MIDLTWDGPNDMAPRLLLAHGAGAAMDSAFMEETVSSLGARGIAVARFEFPYMVRRRASGKRTPPDRAEVLLQCFKQAIAQVGSPQTLFIGGKSMGGRMASMVADELGVAGVVCLGYPFHPPGQPHKTRTEHLRALRTPTLIIQGTCDPFGTPSDVASYTLGRQLTVVWVEGADHDLVGRRRRQARVMHRAIARRIAQFMGA